MPMSGELKKTGTELIPLPFFYFIYEAKKIVEKFDDYFKAAEISPMPQEDIVAYSQSMKNERDSTDS